MSGFSFFSIDSGRGPARNVCRSFASEGGFQGMQGSTLTAIRRRTFLGFSVVGKLFGILVISLSSLSSFADSPGVSRDFSVALCEISWLLNESVRISTRNSDILEMMRKSRGVIIITLQISTSYFICMQTLY